MGRKCRSALWNTSHVCLGSLSNKTPKAGDFLIKTRQNRKFINYIEMKTWYKNSLNTKFCIRSSVYGYTSYTDQKIMEAYTEKMTRINFKGSFFSASWEASLCNARPQSAWLVLNYYMHLIILLQWIFTLFKCIFH